MTTAAYKELVARLKQENENLRARLYVQHDFDHEDDRDDVYRPGCGADDTCDSRGRKLLSRINEAGEPRGYM